ncbi:hypothetical protein D9619_012868 [Psilocybe cf. subviscida]|uniref:Uncharacterized protein n=1 Tax=Psilocybe cf. subviscida TaxID=2480587 RepID=A0A8H5BI32_9AGAR|nr:hypothetical protein D9619_012868 [Psilocybe cf. subviscida]
MSKYSISFRYGIVAQGGTGRTALPQITVISSHSWWLTLDTLPRSTPITHSPSTQQQSSTLPDMPSFEKASNIAISGGNFSEIHGSVYLGHPVAELRKIAEKDSVFNEYSPTEGTLKLPTFTKDLLLNITNVVTDSASRPTSGSCCFDLAWRLGLLPGQPNSGFTEYEPDTPIAEVVTRSTCCCGRISRHGFVHLVSRFFQHASMQESAGSGAIITINTTIGRFKCYEIDDRTFVHFDGSTRSSPINELVDNQDLDHILRSARGQYLMMDSVTFKHMEWGTDDEERIPNCASGNFFGVPDAIMYMTKEKIAAWKLLSDFGKMVLTSTLQYIDTLREPESFCRLVEMQNSPNFDPKAVKPNTPPEMLSLSLYLCRVLSKKSVVAMTYDFYCDFAKHCLHDFLKAHQHYRSPRVEGGKMFTTSQDRFMRMFRTYRAQETGSIASSRAMIDLETMIESELRSVMQTTPNNITLVVYQVFVGMTVYWNAGRMLARSREVPADWIRFVSAEDDYIYLG